MGTTSSKYGSLPRPLRSHKPSSSSGGGSSGGGSGSTGVLGPPNPGAPASSPLDPDVWSLALHAHGRYGARLAVVDCATQPARTYTYAQLAARAAQLALVLAAAAPAQPTRPATATLAATTATSSSATTTAAASTGLGPVRVALLARNCSEALEVHYAVAAARAQLVNCNTVSCAHTRSGGGRRGCGPRAFTRHCKPLTARSLAHTNQPLPTRCPPTGHPLPTR